MTKKTPTKRIQAGRGKGAAKRAVMDAGASTPGALVGTAIGGPPGTVAGVVLTQLTKATAHWVGEALWRRRREQAEFVIQRAAKQSGIDPDALVARLLGRPDLHALFVRTMQLAHDATLDDQLIGLAVSLGIAVDADSEDEVQWEAAFVRIIGELDAAHIKLLEWLARDPGTGEVPDKPVSRSALEEAFPVLRDVLDSLLALLAQHGLIEVSVATGWDENVNLWRLTRFGRTVIDRMQVVSELLRRPEGGK